MLYKMFNNCHYNAWCKYYITPILISDYFINNDIIEYLIKKFGKRIPLIGVYAKKLQKTISLVLLI